MPLRGIRTLGASPCASIAARPDPRPACSGGVGPERPLQGHLPGVSDAGSAAGVHVEPEARDGHAWVHDEGIIVPFAARRFVEHREREEGGW